jgi:hypothetical protein
MIPSFLPPLYLHPLLLHLTCAPHLYPLLFPYRLSLFCSSLFTSLISFSPYPVHPPSLSPSPSPSCPSMSFSSSRPFISLLSLPLFFSSPYPFPTHTQSEQSQHYSFGQHQPCIKLRFRWIQGTLFLLWLLTPPLQFSHTVVVSLFFSFSTPPPPPPLLLLILLLLLTLIVLFLILPQSLPHALHPPSQVTRLILPCPFPLLPPPPSPA